MDKHSEAREEYFVVKQVLSPVKVALNDGRKIRLLGLAPLAEKHDQAVEYLKKKVLGKRVFLKFDALVGEKKDEPLGYLYLANKTFVNAHLLKEGLVGVDDSIEFKKKMNFLKKQRS